MAKIGLPISDTALRLSPPVGTQPPVDDRIQQILALLLGYSRRERVPLSCSPNGILHTASPALTDVVHYTAVGPNEAQQGDNVACTEILCMAHPDNAGKIWVRTRKGALSTNAFPLDAGDVIGFSAENLADLHALTITTGDTLIVGYSL
jgi:hypothetical protein